MGYFAGLKCRLYLCFISGAFFEPRLIQNNSINMLENRGLGKHYSKIIVLESFA
jgi:hypothetical protein